MAWGTRNAVDVTPGSIVKGVAKAGAALTAALALSVSGSPASAAGPAATPTQTREWHEALPSSLPVVEQCLTGIDGWYEVGGPRPALVRCVTLGIAGDREIMIAFDAADVPAGSAAVTSWTFDGSQWEPLTGICRAATIAGRARTICSVPVSSASVYPTVVRTGQEVAFAASIRVMPPGQLYVARALPGSAVVVSASRLPAWTIPHLRAAVDGSAEPTPLTCSATRNVGQVVCRGVLPEGGPPWLLTAEVAGQQLASFPVVRAGTFRQLPFDPVLPILPSSPVIPA